MTCDGRHLDGSRRVEITLTFEGEHEDVTVYPLVNNDVIGVAVDWLSTNIAPCGIDDPVSKIAWSSPEL